MSDLLRSIVNEFKDLYKFRWVTHSFVVSNLKLRYKRSFLGIFWSMLAPALNYLIIGLVFSVLIKNSMPNYFTYMFAGAVFFNFISITIGGGPGILLNNESFIKKIYLPKSIFVLNHTLMEVVNFSFNLFVLVVLGCLFGDLQIGWSWISLLPIVVCGFLFAFGVAAWLGICAVYFRDISHILPVLIQASFFGTPIMYSMSIVPEKYHLLIKLNPFYYFVEAFRIPIFYSAWPSLKLMGFVFSMAAVSSLSGVIGLKYFDNKIIFKL